MGDIEAIFPSKRYIYSDPRPHTPKFHPIRMKKFFSTTGKIFKWTFRIAFFGILIFLIGKFIQAKFYYQETEPEHVAEKSTYLKKVKLPEPDSVVMDQPAPRVIPSAAARMDSVLDSLRRKSPQAAVARRAPNIVLIVCDALGAKDIGSYGGTLIKTPQIDRLAKQGMRFTQFYTPVPASSPARAAILSGRYPLRTGITEDLYPEDNQFNLLQKARNVQVGIHSDEILLAEPLKKAGYATAFIGKWHLGGSPNHLPNDFGFDHFFGLHVSHNMNPAHLYRDDEIVLENPSNQEQLTPSYASEALRFIEENSQNPFFLVISLHQLLDPIKVSSDFMNKSRGGWYGDAVEEIDKNIGDVMNGLSDAGLIEHTVVMLTSDTGPSWQGDTGPYRGRQHEVFEGGIRVPFIVRYPLAIPPGSVVDAAASHIDIFPTLMDMLSLEIPQDRTIDGKSLWAIWEGAESYLSERNLFFFWQKNLYAMRDGKFKFHYSHRMSRFNTAYPSPMEVSQGPWLFDLEFDPSESYDLSLSRNDLLERIREKGNIFLKDLEENPRGWR